LRLSTRRAEGVQQRPVVYGRPVRPPSAPPAACLWAPSHWQGRLVVFCGVAPRPLLYASSDGARVTAPQRGAPYPAPPRHGLCGPTPATRPPCSLAVAPHRLLLLRSAPPLDASSSGARVTAAPEGGAIPGAPLPRLVRPTQATQPLRIVCVRRLLLPRALTLGGVGRRDLATCGEWARSHSSPGINLWDRIPPEIHLRRHPLPRAAAGA